MTQPNDAFCLPAQTKRKKRRLSPRYANLRAKSAAPSSPRATSTGTHVSTQEPPPSRTSTGLHEHAGARNLRRLARARRQALAADEQRRASTSTPAFTRTPASTSTSKPASTTSAGLLLQLAGAQIEPPGARIELPRLRIDFPHRRIELSRPQIELVVRSAATFLLWLHRAFLRPGRDLAGRYGTWGWWRRPCGRPWRG